MRAKRRITDTPTLLFNCKWFEHHTQVSLIKQVDTRNNIYHREREIGRKVGAVDNKLVTSNSPYK